MHHIDYRRVGNEQFGDLLVVCLECHELLEKFTNRLAVKFDRKRIMDRLKPYATRRLLRWHQALCPRWSDAISWRFSDAMKRANPGRHE